jgi:hypothetical protein
MQNDRCLTEYDGVRTAGSRFHSLVAQVKAVTNHAQPDLAIANLWGWRDVKRFHCSAIS